VSAERGPLLSRAGYDRAARRRPDSEWLAQAWPQAPGLVVVDLGDEPAHEALLQRADVMVSPSADRSPQPMGAARVVAPDDESLLVQLRSFIQQPWHWRHGPDGPAKAVLPEDLRLLLAQRRAAAHDGVVGTARRALWSRLPEPLQRFALQILRAARA